MTSAVVYARFSTELQHEKSTEDQIELFRAYAARHGFEFIGAYEDKARSGASVLGRTASCASCTRRDRLEAERQRAIDLLIKGVLDEDSGRVRLAE